MALSDGLVGYWSPWLGSSGYQLLDRTGRGNHGTLTNMDAGTDWVGATIQGRSGYALDFDGSNDFVDIPLRDPLQSLQVPMTIGAWVYKSSGTNGAIFTQYSAVTNHRLIKLAAFSTSEFAYYASTSNGGFQRVAYSTVPSVNNWHFLTWIVQGTLTAPTCRLSADGVEQSFSLSALSTTPNVTVPLRIACTTSTNVPSEHNQVRIAELNVWNRSLLAAEIRELYRLGPGWYQPCQRKRYAFVGGAGFKAYWAKRQSQLIGGGV